MAREDLKELATLKMSMGELDQLAKRIAAEWAFDREQYARECEQAAYERAAMLYENIDPACDHERQNGDPGAGAMGAIIEYRDKIRALAKETEG